MMRTLQRIDQSYRRTESRKRRDIIGITPQAESLAIETLDEVRGLIPHVDWLISFYWATEQQVRLPSESEWTDNGPGLVIGVVQRKAVPESHIQHTHKLEYTVQIPKRILDADGVNLIDRDDNLLGQLRLI